MTKSQHFEAARHYLFCARLASYEARNAKSIRLMSHVLPMAETRYREALERAAYHRKAAKCHAFIR